MKLGVLFDSEFLSFIDPEKHWPAVRCLVIAPIHRTLEERLRIRVTGLIATYTDPHILIAYSDGEIRQEFTFVYAAEIESGELKIDDESKEVAWLPLSSAVELPLAESQRRRLKDVMRYQKERLTLLR